MTMRTLIVIVTGLTLVLGSSLVHAQSDCRGQCDLMLKECKQDCVDAQNFDQCVSSCQGLYQQCLGSCQS